VVDRQEIHERRQHTPAQVPHPCHMVEPQRACQGIPLTSR
jgi:hypothetical protein